MKVLISFLIIAFYSLPAWAVCDGDPRNFNLVDPNDGTPWTVTSKEFRPPASTGNVPVVFILPPISGGNELDQSLALRFCLNGIGSYILNTIKDDPLEIEIYNLNSQNEALIRSHAGVNAAIDELLSEGEVSGNFGVLGSSLGGIQASYVAGAEPQIKSSVILAGAGNLPGILAFSEQSRALDTRQARMEILRMKDQQTYEELMKLFVDVDPLDVAMNVAPGSMFLFITLQDDAVPTRYQQQLREKIPEPRVQEIDAPHAPGIAVAGTLYADEITDFFLEQLD